METLALSEPVLFVLLSLAEQPRHGYSILKDIESMSGGRVLLSTGTLYGALQRLLDNGWIERVEEEDAPRDRRTYRLTSRGRRNLQAIAVAPNKRATANVALDEAFGFEFGIRICDRRAVHAEHRGKFAARRDAVAGTIRSVGGGPTTLPQQRLRWR